MDSFEQELAAAMEVASPKPQVKPQAVGDPIARQAAIHRDAISRQQRDILALERNRDVATRSLESQLAEAGRAYEVEKARITRQLTEVTRSAEQRIALRRTLVRSSQAALAALEPNLSSQEAPIEGRRVPRSDSVAVPIHVHREIRS